MDGRGIQLFYYIAKMDLSVVSVNVRHIWSLMG